MRIGMKLFAAFVIWMTALAPAAAQAPRRIALLIGNADYNRNNAFDDTPTPWFVGDLKNPCNDVNLVKSALGAAFEIFDFCNIDKSEFGTRVAEFASRTQNLPRNSIVFVYYAGHGVQHQGRMFMLPVMMQFNQGEVNGYAARRQAEYFAQNAHDLSDALERITADFGTGVVVALDNCRNNPLDSDGSFNELVNIHAGPNTLVQYATTPGATTSDGVDNSEYAITLARRLRKGGDLGDIMANVQSEIFRLYEEGKRTTYAVTHAGPAFARLTSLQLPGVRVAAATRSIGASAAMIDPTARSVAQPAMAAPTPVATTISQPQPRPAIIRKHHLVAADLPRRVRLDILWCEGPGEDDNFAYASRLADAIKQRRAEFGVGRLMLKPLSERLNRAGGRYNVNRNLMRFDPSSPDERKLLAKLAAAFPEGGFLPQTGIGVGSRPTAWYVSAFVCRVDPAALAP